MVEACAARGYEYMVISDHSKALAMTNGLDAYRLRQQWKEIEEVNETPTLQAEQFQMLTNIIPLFGQQPSGLIPASRAASRHLLTSTFGSLDTDAARISL